MQHLQPNTTLQGGKYRIERVLGQGGFGNTYVGVNTVFNERVAIKEFFMRGVTLREDDHVTVSVSVPDNRESFREQKEKFKKEALRIRLLKNEHIIGVQDFFEENGTAYYVMDYVDGENLAERLKKTGRPMTEQEVRGILPQILDALKAVHDAGIWHLDLKPANIMLDKSGNVKLIDFGASKQLNAQKGGATTSTAISYTNGYAPREQMEQNYDKFGPWTDIYALGATLYNLLTNKRPPLPSDIDDDMSEDKHLALPFPENVGGLKFLVLQMMKTNRLQRPQSVEAIICSEKSRKEEPKTKTPPKNSPQRAPSSNDEETFIAEPQPKQVNKGAATDPKAPKPAVEEKSETLGGDSENPKKRKFALGAYNPFKTFAVIVCAIIAVLIYGNYTSNVNKKEKASEPQTSQVESVEPKFVQRKQYLLDSSAQASGGQIRRSTEPPNSESKERETIKQSDARQSIVQLDKYQQMDNRVRYGCYRIVGTSQVIKAKEGENLKKIANRSLGPDMECYLEVYNGIKASDPLTEGQEIKIPKLVYKKKKEAPIE